jgi:3-oxoacyl-[acyl-carrier-protein] synthase-1
MAANDVVVTGLGATTAVGLTPRECDASIRSASARFAESEFRDHQFRPFTVARLPEKALPQLVPSVDGAVGPTSRERRLVRLAAAALDQLAEQVNSLPFDPALFVALPETRTAIPLDGARWLDLLGAQTRARFAAKDSVATFRGRAGGLAAIDAAATALRSGKIRAALVCGVDSYIDPFVLGTLDLEGRVKSDAHLDGFIPGEGAGAVLLMTPGTAGQHSARIHASLVATANGFETGHLYSEEPYRGDGLAATFQTLFSTTGELPPIGDVYTSMNGESHWGQEWGVGMIRTSPAINDSARIHHPADCYGDVGAASGPLLVVLASLALRTGRGSSPALVYASSDHGDRSALILSRV